MIRRRYRTIHVARLDRLMAEAEAVGRAVDAGAKHARVHRSERIRDETGTAGWEVTLLVSIPRRRRKESSRQK